MPTRVEYNNDLEMVELIYEGTITASDLRDATTQAISLGKEKGTRRYFNDVSTIELSATVMDLYDLPNKQYMEEKADILGCLALVAPSSGKEREAAEFFETVAVNRGWKVKVFNERQEAIDWLIKNTC